MRIIAGLATGGLVGNAMFGNRAAVFLGEISFSIYLIHPVVQIACNQLVRRLHLPGSPTVGLTVLVAELFAVVVGGGLRYCAIEVPARRRIVSSLTQSVSAKPEPLAVSAP
jgi:peptidoglycan/LPS O-acetylase OafA/YrhL